MLGDKEFSKVAKSHGQLPTPNPAILFSFKHDSMGWSLSGVVMGIAVLVDTVLCRSKLPEITGSLGRLGNLPDDYGKVTVPSRSVMPEVASQERHLGCMCVPAPPTALCPLQGETGRVGGSSLGWLWFLSSG